MENATGQEGKISLVAHYNDGELKSEPEEVEFDSSKTNQIF